MSTGEVKAQCRRSQTIDGVAILALRGIAFAQERARSSGDRLAPGSATCRGRRLEAIEGRPGRVCASGPARGLDELDRRERPEPEVVGVLERSRCPGERVVI